MIPFFICIKDTNTSTKNKMPNSPLILTNEIHCETFVFSILYKNCLFCSFINMRTVDSLSYLQEHFAVPFWWVVWLYSCLFKDSSYFLYFWNLFCYNRKRECFLSFAIYLWLWYNQTTSIVINCSIFFFWISLFTAICLTFLFPSLNLILDSNGLRTNSISESCFGTTNSKCQF